MVAKMMQALTPIVPFCLFSCRKCYPQEHAQEGERCRGERDGCRRRGVRRHGLQLDCALVRSDRTAVCVLDGQHVRAPARVRSGIQRS